MFRFQQQEAVNASSWSRSVPARRARTRIVLAGAACAAAVWCAWGVAAQAVEFKMENLVFVGDQQEPITRSKTYFTESAVYDLIKEPAEIAIYEKAAGQFTLVNKKLVLRTEMSTKHIAMFTDRLQQLAAKNADPLIKFSAAPKFEEEFNTQSNELILNSPWLNYRVALAPETDQEIVAQYRDFCDWDARLNTLLSPGRLPPFARLEVNRLVAERRSVPAKVFLTIKSPKAGEPPLIIRSEHRLTRPLAQDDFDYISHLRAALKDFKLVSFDEYHKAAKR